MVGNSFRVFGITTNDPGKVRNDEFVKKIINSVKDKLADEEEELLEDEILLHVSNRLAVIILNIMFYCLNSNFSISCSLVFFLIYKV